MGIRYLHTYLRVLRTRSMNNATTTLLSELRERALQQHVELLDSRSKHNSLLPISRIPLEVLQEIFLIFAEVNISRMVKNSQIHKAILGLTYVCRSWRSAALSFPQMWFLAPTSNENEKLAAMLLERGKASPLRVRHDPTAESTSLQFHPILKSHSARIEEIDVTAPSQRLLSFFSGVGPSFPRLVTLKIAHMSCQGDNRDGGVPPMIDIVAPNVRFLELHKASVPFSRFHDLRDLCLAKLEGETLLRDLISLVSRSPRLRSLWLELLEFSDADDIRADEIMIPELKQLTIWYLDLPGSVCSRILSFAGSNTEVSLHTNDSHEAYELAARHLWVLANPHDLDLRLTHGGSSIQISPRSTGASITINSFDLRHWNMILPHDTDNSRIRSLSLRGVPSSFLARIPVLPNLEQLIVGSFPPADFAKYLGKKIDISLARYVLQELRIMDTPHYRESVDYPATEWTRVIKASIGKGRVKVLCFHMRCMPSVDLEVLRTEASFADEVEFVKLAADDVI